jgi:RHH-type proline utilization regulon transcriptional repressor/proline dehydrogenase/delta 1-pyrroline-5-carboxylate dehydrogenase
VGYRDLEPAIRQIGLELHSRLRAHRRVADRFEQRLVDQLVREPAARARLFQLVDTYPALDGTTDVYAHVAQYLDDPAVATSVRRLIRLGGRLPGGTQVGAAAARTGIMRMATRFIAGRDAASAESALQGLWDRDLGIIVDLLGEKTLSDIDADHYTARLAATVDDLTSGRGFAARGARCSIAIKPTAVAPRFDPLTADAGLAEALDRLRPILRTAADRDLLVWFDMEQYKVRDLTVALFRACLEDGALSGLRAGIVVQAYLRSCERDLAELLDWAAERTARHGPPIGIRLVKGAYWDAETVVARAHGWPVPVFEHKADTDASYERCTRSLLEQRSVVRPAFAGHNLRSIAHAIAVADSLGVARRDLELQMLYGMEAGLADAAHALGPQVNVYAPTGELVPGMAYLVRRLLENSSNESFVRQAGQISTDAELAELLAAPQVTETAA